MESHRPGDNVDGGDAWGVAFVVDVGMREMLGGWGGEVEFGDGGAAAGAKRRINKQWMALARTMRQYYSLQLSIRCRMSKQLQQYSNLCEVRRTCHHRAIVLPSYRHSASLHRGIIRNAAVLHSRARISCRLGSSCSEFLIHLANIQFHSKYSP
jgi:hypothetical protein